MSKKRESCKERDIFFDWNHEIDQDKHFFKIMVGDCRGVVNHSRVVECTHLSPEGEYSGAS